MSLKINKELVVKTVSVILRVPSLFIAEAWCRTNPQTMQNFIHDGKGKEIDPTHKSAITALYYSVMLLAATLIILPLKRLITLYMYLVSACLLGAAHYLSYSFVVSVKTSKVLDATFDNTHTLQLIGCHMIAQCFIGATISYLLNLKHWSRVSLLVYIVPIIAYMLNFPLTDLHRVHNFSAMFSLVIATFFIFHNLPILFDLIRTGIRKVSFTVQLYGWIPFMMAMWFKVLLPVQFLVFWISLFFIQTAKYFSVKNPPVFRERWSLVMLATISECCVTPVSLIGVCFTVSYLAYAILSLTKIYLTGRGGFLHDNVMHKGWTEGFTMFLLSIQTRMIELKSAQRAFLMCIVLFIVSSSLIQSMYEITEPFLLELSAAQNKSVSKHIRAVLLCITLWLFPLFMTYTICQYFDLDFWLMVVISSCVLTSVQVLGSLAVYALFMYDAISKTPWEQLDDVVFYAKSTTRVLEFIVAVFVVAYGVKESLIGEWSWINSSILVIHCYFNVWQRLQAGWKSYLLRREAAKKISSLPSASGTQLREHNDVCPICFQELLTACITPCKHYFHTFCLKKWLYVQEMCPLCHQKIDMAAAGNSHQEMEKESQNGNETDERYERGDGDGAEIVNAENVEGKNEKASLVPKYDGKNERVDTTEPVQVGDDDLGNPMEAQASTAHVRTNSEIKIRQNYVFVESQEVEAQPKHHDE